VTVTRTALTPAEVAALTGKHVETVRLWLRAGKLAHTRTPTGQYLVSPAAVAAMLPEPVEPPETLTARKRRAADDLAAIRAMKIKPH